MPPQVQNQPLPGSDPTIAKHNHLSYWIVIGLLILVAIASTYGVYAWQHRKVNDLNSQIQSLKTQISKTQTSSTKADQDQTQQLLDYGKQTNATATIAGGSIVVDSAVLTNAFKDTAYQGIAVAQVSLNNTSGTDKSFFFSSFSLQLPSGELIKLQGVDPSYPNTNLLTVASGGSVSRNLLFYNVDLDSNPGGAGYLIYNDGSNTAKIPLQFKKPYKF